MSIFPHNFELSWPNWDANSAQIVISAEFEIPGFMARGSIFSFLLRNIAILPRKIQILQYFKMYFQNPGGEKRGFYGDKIG